MLHVAYANAAAIAVLVMIVVVLFNQGRSMAPGSPSDRLVDFLVCLFWAVIGAAQILLAIGLHADAVETWRLVGLYWTSIVLFGAGCVLAYETLRAQLELRALRPARPRLVAICCIVFPLFWLAQIFLLLTR